MFAIEIGYAPIMRPERHLICAVEGGSGVKAGIETMAGMTLLQS
jgi:hypothetical protein